MVKTLIGTKLKKRAFTLIELLGVIVVIGIISLIATPIILNIVEKTKKSAFQDSAYGIISSGRYYYTESMLSGGLTEEKKFILEKGKASGLEFSGTIPNGIVTITPDGKVGIAIYDNKWCASKSKDSDEVTITEYEEGNCIIPDIANDPIITLNGDKEVLIKENAEYIEAGVEAKTLIGDSLNDKVEITISNGVNTVNEIDTSILGVIYTITYTVENNNKIATETRTVKIVDGTSPVITFNPETVELETEEVDSYNLYTGVTVTDNVDGNILVDSANVGTEGSLLKTPGTYEITYTVIDKLGNRASKNRTFIVKDLTMPEITISPNEQNTYVQSKAITISATDNIKLSTLSYILIKDNVRESSTTINAGDTVTLNTTGSYQIEVTAIDESGNSNTLTSGIYLIDTTSPTIIVPENTIVKSNQATLYDLMTNVTYSDNTGETPIITTSGSLSSTVGAQTISYTATDTAGNTITVNRTITVVEADRPILNFSNSGSDLWTKAQTITVIATDNSNLTSFTYEVFKDNVSQGVKTVSVSGKSASANVSLLETGTYTIKLIASDQYGTGYTLTSGTYKIDETVPSYNIIGNPTSWTTSATLTISSASDGSGSGLHATPYSFDGGSTWSATATKTVTSNGTMNVVVRDAVGNKATKSVAVSYIDTAAPTITRKVSSYTTTQGTSYAVTKLYTVTYGSSGGSTVCKTGSTTRTNLSSLAVGSYTLICTATSGAGKTASVSISITIKSNLYALGDAVTFDPGDGISTAWHVLDDDGVNVTLMLDENLGDAVTWYTSSSVSYGPATALAELNSRTSTWTNVPAISSYEYINNEGGSTYSYGYQKLTITNGTAVITRKSGTTKTISGTTRARLITAHEFLYIADGTTDFEQDYTPLTDPPEWLYANLDDDTMFGYWTLTTFADDTDVYYIDNPGWLIITDTDMIKIGIRPIITIPKSRLP